MRLAETILRTPAEPHRGGRGRDQEAGRRRRDAAARSSGSRRRATRIYQEAVGELFLGKPDALEVIKWKEIYDTLERAIDSV